MLLMLAGMGMIASNTAYSRDYFDDKPNLPEALAKGNNIIRFAPISVVDIGAGISLGYERLIGKKKKYGIHFPAHLLIQKRSIEVIGQPTTAYSNFLYLTPGVKFYPKSQKKINYAVGANFVLGYSNNSTTEISRNSFQYTTDDINVAKYTMGAIFCNYANFQITKVLSIGVDGGIGIKFYDRINYNRTGMYNTNASYDNSIDWIGQFSINFGFRF